MGRARAPTARSPPPPQLVRHLRDFQRDRTVHFLEAARVRFRPPEATFEFPRAVRLSGSTSPLEVERRTALADGTPEDLPHKPFVRVEEAARVGGSRVPVVHNAAPPEAEMHRARFFLLNFC